jgi:hypothetical protein
MRAARGIAALAALVLLLSGAEAARELKGISESSSHGHGRESLWGQARRALLQVGSAGWGGDGVS